MNKFHLMAVVVFCFAVIQSTRSLSCHCYKAPRNCAELTSEDCPYGITSDACGCCDMCINGPGEQCGGYWREYGPCAEGYICLRNPNATVEEPENTCKQLEEGTDIDSIGSDLLYPDY